MECLHSCAEFVQEIQILAQSKLDHCDTGTGINGPDKFSSHLTNCQKFQFEFVSVCLLFLILFFFLYIYHLANMCCY